MGMGSTPGSVLAGGTVVEAGAGSVVVAGTDGEVVSVVAISPIEVPVSTSARVEQAAMRTKTTTSQAIRKVCILCSMALTRERPAA